MVLTALLLITLAVALCAAGILMTLKKLGLGLMQTLLYLGLAEFPPPRVARRPTERGRAAASRQSVTARAA